MMNKRILTCVHMTGLLAMMLASTVAAAGSHAVKAVRNAPRVKHITVEEYAALKREISTLREQVTTLLKHAGTQEERGAKPRTDSERGKDLAQHVPVTASSAAKSEESARAASSSSTNSFSAELSEGDRKQEAEEARRQLDTFLRSQKLLFKKGQLQAEVTTTYSSDVQINNCTVLGPYRCVLNATDGSAVTVPRISSRGADMTLIARYGVVDNVEFDLFVPLSYLEQENNYYLYFGRSGPNIDRFGTGTVTRREAAGLGDIAASLRYALRREDGVWPDITLSLDAKSDTGDFDRGLGSGFWNVGGSMTLVKTIDPVVLFGSVGYVATLENFGVNPGDQIPYSLGMGFSLNDRVSFRIAMSGAQVRRTLVQGQGIPTGPGYDVSTLQFSTTIQYEKNLFFEPFVGIGLTEESPDFVAGLRIPYRFSGKYVLPFLN